MKAKLPYAAAAFATALLNLVPIAAPAAAQQRIRQVVIFGNDRCPEGRGDEIVVCSRRPENERYRLPESARGASDTSPERRSWATRARTIRDVGNTGIGSCSTVGPGGQSGCLQEIIDASEGVEEANAPNSQPQ